MVLGLLLVGLVGSASAQQESEVAREKAAKKACALGDYERGTDILADLFVATDKIVYVYNQARCYQQNNRWERALARFREFLRKAKHLTKAQRVEVERNIAECEAALREAQPPATPEPASPTPSHSVAQAPVLVPAPAAEVQPPPAAPLGNTPPPRTPVSNPGRGLRIAGLVLGVSVRRPSARVCSAPSRHAASPRMSANTAQPQRKKTIGRDTKHGAGSATAWVPPP
jgi:hypothetical protein